MAHIPYRAAWNRIAFWTSEFAPVLILQMAVAGTGRYSRTTGCYLRPLPFRKAQKQRHTGQVMLPLELFGNVRLNPHCRSSFTRSCKLAHRTPRCGGGPDAACRHPVRTPICLSCLTVANTPLAAA